MSESEKQAVYDEMDQVMASHGTPSPELLAKMDQVIAEDFPELAEQPA